MKKLMGWFLILTQQTLAPAPINFSNEYVPVAGKVYHVTYDANGMNIKEENPLEVMLWKWVGCLTVLALVPWSWALIYLLVTAQFQRFAATLLVGVILIVGMGIQVRVRVKP